VNGPTRRIHVRDHLVDRRIAVGRNSSIVGAGGVEQIDRSGKGERSPVCSFDFLAGAFIISRRTRQSRVNLPSAIPSAGTDSGFAEEEVEQDAYDRQRKDGNDPREPGSGLAVRAQKSPHYRHGVGKKDDA
ncbi:MAG TPA: hypothetical protein VGQ34_04830, partial [Sphingomicrobium sp.]|jgi:hypothetical protein|nr:hypothetical protein [Sphingomicrobium sp.]